MTEATKQSISDTLPSPEGKDLARVCARLFDERRLTDVVVFDIGAILQVADYFVLATGVSPRQVKKAADGVLDALRAHRIRPFGVEGYEQGRWILIDLGDVVLHLMVEEARLFYNMELLWGDCPQLAWNDGKP